MPSSRETLLASVEPRLFANAPLKRPTSRVFLPSTGLSLLGTMQTRAVMSRNQHRFVPDLFLDSRNPIDRTEINRASSPVALAFAPPTRNREFSRNWCP